MLSVIKAAIVSLANIFSEPRLGSRLPASLIASLNEFLPVRNIICSDAVLHALCCCATHVVMLYYTRSDPVLHTWYYTRSDAVLIHVMMLCYTSVMVLH